MSDSIDTSILHTFQNAAKVCAEVLAASTVLETCFQSALPQGLAANPPKCERGTGGGSQLFDVYSCEFTVERRGVKNSLLGWATYMFDLGNLERYAAVKQMPLVVAAWAGSSSNSYGYYNLKGMAAHHKVFARRLMRWVESGEREPHEELEGRGWLYSVPLAKLNTEGDLIRLLVKPLISLATAPALTSSVVELAFRDAPEVLIEGN